MSEAIDRYDHWLSDGFVDLVSVAPLAAESLFSWGEENHSMKAKQDNLGDPLRGSCVCPGAG
jgi:hypothetical protein